MRCTSNLLQLSSSFYLLQDKTQVTIRHALQREIKIIKHYSTNNYVRHKQPLMMKNPFAKQINNHLQCNLIISCGERKLLYDVTSFYDDEGIIHTIPLNLWIITTIERPTLLDFLRFMSNDLMDLKCCSNNIWNITRLPIPLCVHRSSKPKTEWACMLTIRPWSSVSSTYTWF